MPSSGNVAKTSSVATPQECLGQLNMAILSAGDVCVKLVGRERGRIAVVVEVLDEKRVLIDGDVRRRLCGVNVLRHLGANVPVAPGTSRESILSSLEGLDLVSTANEIIVDTMNAQDLGRILLRHGWKLTKQAAHERTYERDGQTVSFLFRGKKIDPQTKATILARAGLTRDDCLATPLVRNPIRKRSNEGRGLPEGSPPEDETGHD